MKTTETERFDSVWATIVADLDKLEANPSVVRQFDEPRIGAAALDSQSMFLSDLPTLLASMKNVQQAFETLEKKSLIYRVHFGAQLQSLFVKLCSKKVFACCSL